MKTLITKFISILLILIILFSYMVLASCLTAVTVSAAETTTSETSSSELIYDFDAVPLSIKADLYDDSGIKYDNYLILKQSNIYRFMLFGSDVDFLSLDSSNVVFFKDDVSVDRKLYVIFYNHDGTYKKQYTSSIRSYEYFGYTYAYDYNKNSNDYIENWVNNVVYSSLDVKYNGLTVYYAKNNKAVTIKDLLDLPAGTGGGEIVGPQPIPSDSKTLYGGYVEKNEETWSAFLAWLVENEYYTDLAKYGLVVTASNIGSIADTWYENKMSPTLFFEIVKQNGVNSLSSAEKIIGWFNRKWQEYISHNYEKIQVGTGGTKSDPHHRANLITDETDEDGNITDTVDISILRDILRRLIEIPNDIYSFFGGVINNIANNIYSLCLYAYDMPENVSNAIYNNLVNPFNLILDAINNSSGGTTTTENVTNNYYTYNTDVSDSEQEAFNGLFTEYNQKYDELIRSKFPFISQVSGIFDEVWQACGYNSASESSLDVQSESMTVNQGSQQTQQDFINSKMVTVFDSYNPSYFSGVDASNAPSYTVTVAGTECNIIDFRIFEKYRTTIHAIITLVFWLPFLLNLLKAVPNIIANVSDYFSIASSMPTLDYTLPEGTEIDENTGEVFLPPGYGEK